MKIQLLIISTLAMLVTACDGITNPLREVSGTGGIGSLLEYTQLSIARASFVGRTYSDRNTSMKGSCKASNGATITYDLDYQKGWNLVFLADSAGGGLSIATNFKTLTAEDVKFIFLSASNLTDLQGRSVSKQIKHLQTNQ